MFHPKTLRKNLNYTLDVLSLLIFKSLFFLSLETTFFFPKIYLSHCPYDGGSPIFKSYKAIAVWPPQKPSQTDLIN